MTNPIQDIDAGSRQHVLDLVETSDFSDRLTRVIQDTGIVVKPSSQWFPQGRQAPDEVLLSRPCEELLDQTVSTALRNWWLAVPRNANEPNWDLVSTASFPERKQGLVLVEAKAHVRELKTKGKTKRNSPNSLANHERIGNAIQAACRDLNAIIPGVCISRDSHYQLANRIAFAWKLASLGVPVVLLYLGFTGDKGISDLSRPLADAEHWRQVMNRHCEGILPGSFVGREICCGPASMWFLVRSLPCLRQSPPKSERKPVRLDRQAP